LVNLLASLRDQQESQSGEARDLRLRCFLPFQKGIQTNQVDGGGKDMGQCRSSLSQTIFDVLSLVFFLWKEIFFSPEFVEKCFLVLDFLEQIS
jgi:hypothetical protein